MARRKNVKRIDPRYFLHETVFREGFDRLNPPEPNDTSAEALAYWANEILSARLGLTLGKVQGLGANFPKGIKAPDGEALEDLHSYQLARVALAGGQPVEPGMLKKLDAISDALQARGFEDSGKEKFARPGSPDWKKWGRDAEEYPGSNKWDNRPEEGVPMEEGWDEFAQGAKDTWRDLADRRPLGKSRQIRKDAEEARRLDDEEYAARLARDKEFKSREAAEKQERIRAANAAMERGADRMRRGWTDKDDEDLEYRRDRMDPDRHARRKRERERRHSGFGSDHYVEQE